MDIEEFRNNMNEKGKKIDIVFSEKQIEKFYAYMNILIEWNKKINLTAIIEPKDIILKHFIDSLTILKYINENDKIIDVGTGAGFPGIPLKIMKEDLDITLLDSLNKRINFLNEVITSLNLKNIKTVHARIEDAGKDISYREKYDITISRAVSNLATLSEYMLPLTKINGYCICMKGAEIEDELLMSEYAIDFLGGFIYKKEELNLTEQDNKRNIIILKKVKKTSNKYPRKPGIPSKEPILKDKI